MNIQQPKAFTEFFDERKNAIQTLCGISTAYNPNTFGLSSHPPVEYFDAIWDTGATNSVITQKVIDALNLKSVGKVPVNTASGPDVSDLFFVNIILPNEVGFHSVKVTQGKVAKADVLIGMDIISKGDFAITSKDGKTVFSFQFPSTHTYDFKYEIAHTPVLAGPKVGRNDPCPCGSGKKYKNCCGK